MNKNQGDDGSRHFDSLETMKIESITLQHISMPLVAPFETSFGRETDRQCILLELRADGGATACVPPPSIPRRDRRCAVWVAECCAAFGRRRRRRWRRSWCRRCRARESGGPSVAVDVVGLAGITGMLIAGCEPHQCATRPVGPRPKRMPDEIVQDSREHRRRGRGDERPSSQAHEQGEHRELHGEAGRTDEEERANAPGVIHRRTGSGSAW